MSADALRALARAALLALAVLGPVGPAAADGDSDAERAQQVIDAIRGGRAAAAVEKLGTGAAADALVARPELLHVVLDRAYRTDARLAAQDGDARKTLVARLAALAVRAHAAAPANDDAGWARALGLVLEQRVAAADSGAWGQAADLLEAVHKRTPRGGEALSYAVSFLLEGACSDEALRHRLQTRADALTRKAVRRHPEHGLARALGASHLWAARTLAGAQRKAAKQALRATLDTLEPHLAKDDPSLDTATLFNDAVTLGKQTGFTLGAKYFMLPADALEGGVEFDVPLSRRWDVRTVPSSEESPGYTYVTQTDAAGRRVRQILFRRYYWGSSYTFEDEKPVNGDSVKKIVRGLQAMTAETTFATGAKLTRPGKHRLTPDLVGQRFELRGTTLDEKPEPLHIVGFGARGSQQATLVVLVYVWGGAEGLGPETEAVLASLREPEE